MASVHYAPPPPPMAFENRPPPVTNISRTTQGGRNLHYRLTLIQQPERARACGSGPKSSTDRRPIDPPPVLCLKIVEGDSFETGRDITFDYKANFFVFTSLEHARPMAHGRVQTPHATTPPVLTGVPVGGACYLDRPEAACYFLFPDLSVRHEGLYKLNFCLWEETFEKSDRDLGESDVGQDGEGFSAKSASDQYFKSRMQVSSDPFTVFSAKKFPGLAQSTALSRTIAEQGCRVRIRRDVRMRKRDNKPGRGGRDFNDEQPEESYPNGYDRGRSASNSSIDRRPYPESRRHSGADQYPPLQPHPHPAYAQPAPPSNYPAYGPPAAAPPHSHYAQPALAISQPPISPSYPPTPASAGPSPTSYHPARFIDERRSSQSRIIPMVEAPSRVPSISSLPSLVPETSPRSDRMDSRTDSSYPDPTTPANCTIPAPMTLKRSASPGPDERLVDRQRPSDEAHDHHALLHYMSSVGERERPEEMWYRRAGQFSGETPRGSKTPRTPIYHL